MLFFSAGACSYCDCMDSVLDILYTGEKQPKVVTIMLSIRFLLYFASPCDHFTLMQGKINNKGVICFSTKDTSLPHVTNL